MSVAARRDPARRGGSAIARLCAAGLLLAAPAAAQDRVEPERIRPERPPAAAPPGAGPSGSRVLPEHLRAAAIGITALEARLGPAAPTGAGVPIAIVEGSHDGGWMPRRGLDRYRGVRFIVESPDPGRGGHADAVCTALLARATMRAGRSVAAGVAPGIERVHMWESAHWLGPGGLRTGEPAGPRRLPEGVRLLAAAWVGDSGPRTAEIIARLDVLAHGGGVLVVNGLPNGGRPFPLLSSATNGLPVGVRAAGHVSAPAGARPRPELVAPAGTTSEAVAMVAGVAARLLESVDRRETRLRRRFVLEQTPEARQREQAALLALARRPEVLRAVLMASAIRENAYSGRWSGDPASAGLDGRVGAGTVHVDRALRTLEAGQPEGGGPRGWTAATATRLPTRGEIPVAEGARELVAVAVWHRVFDGSIDSPVLPRRALGLAAPGSSDLAAVTQTASGVAFVRIADPEPGRWTLVLAGDRPEGPEDPASPIAVAWWTDGPGEGLSGPPADESPAPDDPSP